MQYTHSTLYKLHIIGHIQGTVYSLRTWSTSNSNVAIGPIRDTIKLTEPAMGILKRLK